MRTANVMFFTEKEEEFANLLIELGTRRNVAKVLVFLANIPEATSRAIERGTDLRQPEVSIAITCLSKRKWVCISSLITVNRGRPVKIFALTGTIDSILDEIKEGISEGHDQHVIMLGRIREIVRK